MLTKVIVVLSVLSEGQSLVHVDYAPHLDESLESLRVLVEVDDLQLLVYNLLLPQNLFSNEE